MTISIMLTTRDGMRSVMMTTVETMTTEDLLRSIRELHHHISVARLQPELLSNDHERKSNELMRAMNFI
jgi:hypothetical protein